MLPIVDPDFIWSIPTTVNPALNPAAVDASFKPQPLRCRSCTSIFPGPAGGNSQLVSRDAF